MAAERSKGVAAVAVRDRRNGAPRLAGVARRESRTIAESRPSISSILTLEQLDAGRFRGLSHVQAPRIFGGQTFAQAVLAAGRTVAPDRLPHHAQAHFLLPGRADLPVDYRVESLRDGGSYSTRMVYAHQAGADILALTASFQRHRDGFAFHTAEPPAVPEPAELPTLDELVAADLPALGWLRDLASVLAIDLRLPETFPQLRSRRGEVTEPEQWMWLRVGPLADDPLIRAAAVAYCSDLFLVSAAFSPQGGVSGSPGTDIATLNHSAWLHADAPIDQWHLYQHNGFWSGDGRGMARGVLFRRGEPVATTMQEGLRRSGGRARAGAPGSDGRP